MQRINRVFALFIIYVIASPLWLLADTINAYPFASSTVFNKTYKEQEFSAGIYGDYYMKKDVYKIGVEYKQSTYSDSQFNNSQVDTIVGYLTPLKKNVYIEGAAHVTFSNLYQADINQIYLLGVSFKKPSRFQVGIDGYYSNYNAFSLAKEVVQISPYVGIWYGNVHSRLGKVYVELTYNRINPSSSNVALSSTYDNIELSCLQLIGRFTNTLAYSFGKNVHLVRDKAFSVYNNNEIHDKGIILSSAYRYASHTFFKFSYIYEEIVKEYDPLLSPTPKTKGSMQRFVLSGSYRF